MNKRRRKGQEATEFVLITILVFFSALIVVTIFGGKIANFFKGDSSVTKMALTKTKTISAADQQKYDIDIEPVNIPKITPAVDTTGATNQATANSGESYSVEINGQNVNIPKSAVEAMNKAMETTAATGTLNNIIADIEYMSTKFNVPASDIEIMFGTSKQSIDVIRKKGAKTENKQIPISGNADINMICLKYNDQILIRNKSLKAYDTVSDNFNPTVQLKIEGSIGSDNKFTSTNLVASNDNKFAAQSGQTPTYNTTVQIKPDGSLIFDAGQYDLKHSAFSITSDTGAKNTFYSTGDLSLEFSNPNYRFSLK